MLPPPSLPQSPSGQYSHPQQSLKYPLKLHFIEVLSIFLLRNLLATTYKVLMTLAAPGLWTLNTNIPLRANQKPQAAQTTDWPEGARQVNTNNKTRAASGDVRQSYEECNDLLTYVLLPPTFCFLSSLIVIRVVTITRQWQLIQILQQFTNINNEAETEPLRENFPPLLKQDKVL